MFTQEPVICPCPEPGQSNTHPTNPITLRSIFISSSNLCLHLPSASFPSHFPSKTVYAHPTQLILLLFDHPSNIWWGLQVIKLLIMQSPPVPCHFIPLRPKYITQHPILKDLTPSFLPWCNTHIKQEAKLRVAYILIFTFFNCNLEGERFWTKWQYTFPEFSLFFTSSWIQFCYSCFQIPELCNTFKGFTAYLYIVISFCILFTAHEHILNFLSIYF